MDLIKGEKNKNQNKIFVFLENTKVFLFSKSFKKQKVCILIVLIMTGFFCFSFVPNVQAIPFPVDTKEIIKETKSSIGNLFKNIFEIISENVKKITKQEKE